jgi:hypothetical protein
VTRESERFPENLLLAAEQCQALDADGFAEAKLPAAAQKGRGADGSTLPG